MKSRKPKALCALFLAANVMLGSGSAFGQNGGWSTTEMPACSTDYRSYMATAVQGVLNLMKKDESVVGAYRTKLSELENHIEEYRVTGDDHAFFSGVGDASRAMRTDSYEHESWEAKVILRALGIVSNRFLTGKGCERLDGPVVMTGTDLD